ncbi:P-loop NTPase [bacterium]|nr:P-loop NTPase [bacterium]
MSVAEAGGLTIEELCGRTGLEESAVRFYEARYPQLLPPRRLGRDEVLFAPETADVLLRLDGLFRAGTSSPEALAARLEECGRSASRAGFAQVLAVTSGKGGVGKSNLALALAIEMSRRGLSTLLLDADLGAANQHILAGVSPAATLDDVVLHGRSRELLVTPGPEGIGLIAGASGIYQLANLNPLEKRTLFGVFSELEARADVLVVDTGTGLSDNVVEFAARADEVVVVTTPDLTSITDAYGMLKTLARLGSEGRLGVVANRVQSVMEGEAVYRRLLVCSERFLGRGVEYLGHVYRDGVIERATGARRPFLLLAPDSRAARCVWRIADEIFPRLCRRKTAPSALVRRAG